jgi:hypothetical protein
MLIKEILHYDPETGVFTWKISRGRVRAGEIAGYIHKTDGYRRIGAEEWGLKKASRLAFLYMTGNWPENQIDHINGVRSDDRWSNLRNATHGENLRNGNKRLMNVHKNNKGWSVRVYVNKKAHTKYFRHDQYQDAVAYAQELRTTLHGEFANHGSTTT